MVLERWSVTVSAVALVAVWVPATAHEKVHVCAERVLVPQLAQWSGPVLV